MYDETGTDVAGGLLDLLSHGLVGGGSCVQRADCADGAAGNVGSECGAEHGG